VPKKSATPAGGVADADLRLALRDAITRLAKPTSAAELRKALPRPYQRPVAEIGRHLAELARERSLFAFQDGKTSRFTLHDPRQTVERATLAALGSGPLAKKDLTARVKRAAPGFEKVLPVVLADLLARGAVREHPKVGKHPARYGLEPPDPTPFLAKALKEIQAVQKKLAPCGVTPAALYAALGHVLGLTKKTSGDGAADDEAAVLSALRELASREPPGALLSVRALRALRPLPKARFDGAVLRLSRAGTVVLHHHDFPASLGEAERAELVEDERGVHYVGIAPGRSA
jgi:hypothetical protein